MCFAKSASQKPGLATENPPGLLAMILGPYALTPSLSILPLQAGRALSNVFLIVALRSLCLRLFSDEKRPLGSFG